MLQTIGRIACKTLRLILNEENREEHMSSLYDLRPETGSRKRRSKGFQSQSMKDLNKTSHITQGIEIEVQLTNNIDIKGENKMIN